MSREMFLKELSIRRLDAWQDKSRPFVGKMKVEGAEYETELKISDEACRKILEVAAKGIQQAGSEVATFLRQEASTLVQLEAPKERS